MAYRRKQGITKSSTFKEEVYRPSPSANASDDEHDNNFRSSSLSHLHSPSPSSTSLAAQAIRASAAHRDSSFFSASHRDPDSAFKDTYMGQPNYDYTRNSNEAGGFWGVLAKKAKALIDEEEFEGYNPARPETFNSTRSGQYHPTYPPHDSSRKMENPKLRKGLDALASSLNHIGGTIGNALEEGRAIVENKTADIIQETRRLQIRRKGDEGNYVASTQEDQIKASRDVAMATAAKAKLLLRELKTVKADLAFAKLRCSQLEEENKFLRESRGKRDNLADDELIRLQLETLLAEKARLAHENSIYARENRFLREIVEYHQLTMQDLVYLDEGIEEVTEVNLTPAISRMLSVSPPSPRSPSSSREISPSRRLSFSGIKEKVLQKTRSSASTACASLCSSRESSPSRSRRLPPSGSPAPDRKPIND